jgi:Na+(H+)/acetate symporter ActP
MAIGTTDLVILVAYLIATVAFGLYMGRGQKSATDYLLGGRNLPWWVLLLSIVATETSTATFLSVPGIAFGTAEAPGNLLFLQLPLGYLIGRTIAAYGLLPLYFKGKLFTAYDVLNQRSGPHVRSMASALFLITRTLADGLRLYLAAIVMQFMFGCTLSTAVISMGIATVIYTVVGGIKAVVWTDAIQFVVYMTGAIIAFFVMGQQLDGGLSATFQTEAMQERLRCFDFGFDFSSPYTFWAGMIGGAVLSIGSHGVDCAALPVCTLATRCAEGAAVEWPGCVNTVRDIPTARPRLVGLLRAKSTERGFHQGRPGARALHRAPSTGRLGRHRTGRRVLGRDVNAIEFSVSLGIGGRQRFHPAAHRPFSGHAVRTAQRQTGDYRVRRPADPRRH